MAQPSPGAKIASAASVGRTAEAAALGLLETHDVWPLFCRLVVLR